MSWAVFKHGFKRGLSESCATNNHILSAGALVCGAAISMAVIIAR